MARKSDSGIGVAIVVITLIVAFLGGLIVIATVSSTVLIAAYWVYAYVRARALPDAPGSNAFVLTAAERVAFDSACTHLREAESEMASLWSQGARFARRNDGMFHERSDLARQLNNSIRKNHERQTELKRRVEWIGGLPTRRREAYVGRLGAFRAASVMAIAFVLAFDLLVLATPHSLAGYSDWIDSVVPVSLLAILPHSAFAAASIAGVLAWLVFLIARFIAAQREDKRVKEMSKVSMEVAEAHAIILASVVELKA